MPNEILNVDPRFELGAHLAGESFYECPSAIFMGEEVSSAETLRSFAKLSKYEESRSI